jgi:hypothetical protein
VNLDTLRLLVAKGLSAEDILEVAETMGESATAERSSSAERQARYRLRKAQAAAACDATGDVTGDVTRYATGDGNGGDATSLSLPPNEINSNPPTHTHPGGTTGASEPADLDGLPVPASDDLPKPAKPPKAKRAVADAVPMPEGWEPRLTPAAQKIVDGWPPGMFERERMAFEAHAASTDRVTKDWQAAFRTWIAKAEQYRTERNGDRSAGTGRGFAGGHQPDRRDGFTRSLDDTIKRGRGGTAPLQ